MTSSIGNNAAKTEKERTTQTMPPSSDCSASESSQSDAGFDFDLLDQFPLPPTFLSFSKSPVTPNHKITPNHTITSNHTITPSHTGSGNEEDPSSFPPSSPPRFPSLAFERHLAAAGLNKKAVANGEVRSPSHVRMRFVKTCLLPISEETEEEMKEGIEEKIGEKIEEEMEEEMKEKIEEEIEIPPPRPRLSLFPRCIPEQPMEMPLPSFLPIKADKPSRVSFRRLMTTNPSTWGFLKGTPRVDLKKPNLEEDPLTPNSETFDISLGSTPKSRYGLPARLKGKKFFFSKPLSENQGPEVFNEPYSRPTASGIGGYMGNDTRNLLPPFAPIKGGKGSQKWSNSIGRSFGKVMGLGKGATAPGVHRANAFAQEKEDSSTPVNVSPVDTAQHSPSPPSTPPPHPSTWFARSGQSSVPQVPEEDTLPANLHGLDIFHPARETQDPEYKALQTQSTAPPTEDNTTDGTIEHRALLLVPCLQNLGPQRHVKHSFTSLLYSNQNAPNPNEETRIELWPAVHIDYELIDKTPESDATSGTSDDSLGLFSDMDALDDPKSEVDIEDLEHWCQWAYGGEIERTASTRSSQGTRENGLGSLDVDRENDSGEESPGV